MAKEHTPFTHLHKFYSSSIRAYPPLTRYIQDAYWGIVEDTYEDALLTDQIVLVSYDIITYQNQTIRIDFQSKKVDCLQASPDRPCWDRYVIYSLEGEPSPMPWNMNGVQYHS